MTKETYLCLKCFILVKRQFSEKIRFFPLRNFRLLHYPGMQLCCNSLLSNVLFNYVFTGHLRKVKKFLALKVVVAAYEVAAYKRFQT